MSRGKYSPNCPHAADSNYEYKYNCYGDLVPELDYDNLPDDWAENHMKKYFDDYDSEGYDMYGYSCFDKDGNYVGAGAGIDRDGWTETDYLTLQDIPEEHRDSYHYYNS